MSDGFPDRVDIAARSPDCVVIDCGGERTGAKVFDHLRRLRCCVLRRFEVSRRGAGIERASGSPAPTLRPRPPSHNALLTLNVVRTA